MKIMSLTALALLATLCPAPVQAMPENTPPPLAFSIMTDTATVLNVAAASHTFTSIPSLSGSHFIVVQSTDATASFCCSFEASAATTTVAGTPGCIQAKKEAGLGFYEARFDRWGRDLVLRCQTFKTTTSTILRVLQGR